LTLYFEELVIIPVWGFDNRFLGLISGLSSKLSLVGWMPLIPGRISGGVPGITTYRRFGLSARKQEIITYRWDEADVVYH
jgi:hypothetical protein